MRCSRWIVGLREMKSDRLDHFACGVKGYSELFSEKLGGGSRDAWVLTVRLNKKRETMDFPNACLRHCSA